MDLWFYLHQPFAQHALIAATLVAVTAGLLGPFVITRGAAFAVHGTAELSFTGAAAGLLVGGDPIAGALTGSVVVAVAIGLLGARERERDSAIGVILAFGLGVGVYLLSHYHGFSTEATNILFGQIFGVSGGQLTLLLAVAGGVIAATAVLYRPLLFASVDPVVAEARGVPTRAVGLAFLVLLALTVTEAAQIVGTLLVLSLAITPAAAAGRLAARPATVTAVSVGFALAAADGGLLVSLETNVKASVLVSTISFAIYLVARLAGARPVSPGRSAQDAALVGDGDGGRPVADAELVVQVDEVGLDRGLADEQPAGGGLVGRAAGDEAQDLELAGAQAAGLAGAEAAHEGAGDGGGEHRPAGVRGPDGADQLVAGGVLEQVAGGARLDRGQDVAVGVERREHQDPGRVIPLP
jgi:zinc/manganese transport system permease protein